MTSIRDNILERLFAAKDDGYARFHASLVPTLDKELVIGVRIPVLRKTAKELFREYGTEGLDTFLTDLPHTYYEENMLHGLLSRHSAS